jgi:hypothetical protein
MNLIKKYWKLFTGAILAIFGVSVLYTHKNDIINPKAVEPKNIVDDKIKENKAVVEEAEVKIEEVAEQKKVTKKRINRKRRKVKDLEDAKQDVPNIDRTLAEAKHNIIKKTERE